MPSAEQIRALIEQQQWAGTVSELAATLADTNSTVRLSPIHLAIWLRRQEPTLWWTYGISVRFSRTGRGRLVHLARRKPLSLD